MTVEELEKAWLNLSDRIDRIEKNEIDRERLFGMKRKTALDSLASRYRRFSTVAFVMILPGMMSLLNPLSRSDIKWWVAGYCILYMVVAGCMDGWLYKGVSAIDVTSMPVLEVGRLCRFYRRRHHQFMLLLIPLACIFIGLICYAFRFDPYFIAGAVAGCVAGIIIGTVQYLKFVSDYKTVTSD